MTRHQISEAEGNESLHAHIFDCAKRGRDRYGPVMDMSAIEACLADRQIVRYPVTIKFDQDLLQTGEFGCALQAGETPADGFVMAIHPHFMGREEALPALIAYHLVTINYGDIVTGREAELFGSTLLGEPQDAYYERVCRCADELLSPAD